METRHVLLSGRNSGHRACQHPSLYDFVLDPIHCASGSACAQLLEETIVTMNPIWGAAAGNGLEAASLFAYIGKLCIDPATGLSLDTAICVATIAQLFSLNADEAAAFVGHIVASPPDQVQRRAGMYLMQATAAAQQVPGGCLLGSYVLESQKCAGPLATSMTVVIPTMIMPGLRDGYGAQYGDVGGSGMPLFVKVNVKEFLGWQGATFSEPLMQLD